MSTGISKTSSADLGLSALVMLLRFHGLGADPEQLRHRFGAATIGIPEMLRCAKDLGLKAQSRLTTWERLVSTPLPGIVALRDGGFLLLGKVDDGKALVQSPLSPRPAMMTRAEFETVWDGRLVLMTRRAGLVDLSRRFDITWFLGAIHKYRRLLGEVLVASFFLQVFALVSPLFFQVVIDKVLVHRTLSTLDVLIIGLVAIAVFETVLGILRTYLFAHTTNRIDVELGARLFRHLVALPIAYFQARRVGDSVARVRELENIRNFLTSSALTLIIDLLFTFVFLAVMFVYSPFLTFVVVGAFPFYNADPTAEFHPPAAAPASLVAMQRQFLMSQTSEFAAKLAALDRQRAQKEAERATIVATIAKLDATIPILQQRVDIRKGLTDKELVSKITYLETLHQLVDQQQEHKVQESRYQEAEAALAAIIETRAQAEAEYRRALSSDLVEAERKAAGLSEDLVKAEQRTKLQVLTAPVDGVVQQLAVHTVGGVVTPAQALLVVVPAESRLEIEAMVSNRDIGFVHPGQQAEIKVDTFPFTRYGLLRGTVLTVSQDAITHDKPQDQKGDKVPGAESSTSEPKGQELVYAAHISLPRTQMQIDDNLINLSPGMAVTVEIKTGSRTVISYLLSPLMRYKHESLRER
jgi:hemolysin D